MRVLFLCEIGDPTVGSAVRQTYQLAARLRELGHKTALVATVRDEDQARPTEVDGTLVFRLHSDYPVRWRAWVSLHNRVIDRPLEALLAQWQPDVVHAQIVHTHLGYHSLTQARQAGAGVVFTAHDVMTFCYQKLTCFHGGERAGGKLWDVTARLAKCIPCQRFRFRPGRNRAIARVLERDVQRMVVVSDALGEVLAANGIRVHRRVHNAIALSPEPAGAAAVAAFLERHDLVGRPVIALGGRLHSQKGVGKALEMLVLLRGEFPDLRLLVMGRREIYEGEFAARARSLGVDDMVLPTGWLDGAQLACAYAAADVFLTPSLCFDTFGLVNLEAMAQATPVVATSFGGSREVVLEGQTGFVANPFEVSEYAERIARLLRDPDLARRAGEAGYLRVREDFTIERLTDEYLEEYALAVAAARGGPPGASG